MSVRWATLLLGIGLVALALLVDLGEFGFGVGQRALAIAGLGVMLVAALPEEWNRNLWVTLSGAAAGVLLAEAGLQGFARLRFSTIYQVDSEILYRHIPESSKSFKRARVNGGTAITVRINSSGYRGDDLSDPKRGKRVIVYGDSFVAATFSALEDTFVEQLEQRLRSQLDTEVEVVNAGVVGYGPDQIALRLAGEVQRTRADLALVVICAANDHGDLVRNKLFFLEGGERLLRLQPVLSEDLASKFHQASGGWLGYKLALKAWRLLRYGVRPPKEGPELEEFQRDMMQEWLEDRKAEYRDLLEDSSITVNDIFGDYYDADMSLTPGSESASYKAALMESVMGRIVRDADSSGISVVWVFVPAEIDACERHDLARVDQSHFPDYKRSALTDILEGIADRNGYPYVNLFEPFRRYGADELYFLGADDHWNDRGQAVAADLVSDFLADSGLLGEAPNL